MRLVLFKPLYYFSMVLFIAIILTYFFSPTWSVVMALSLLVIWSRVPGFAHFILNKLAVNDLFTFIVAANLGGGVGLIFGVIGTMFARIFGPYEWFPYTLRATISISFAALATPSIINYTGGANWQAFIYFEVTMYVIYYLLVILFWREEIPLEIAIIPAVIFFDFIMNNFLLQLFGSTISNMITNGLSSGWPFVILVGLMLGFWAAAKNSDKIAKRVYKFKEKLGIDNNKYLKKIEKILQN